MGRAGALEGALREPDAVAPGPKVCGYTLGKFNDKDRCEQKYVYSYYGGSLGIMILFIVGTMVSKFGPIALFAARRLTYFFSLRLAL